MPTMVQSVGVSSRRKGKLASLPRHQKTSSPTPAPMASRATSGDPCGRRFASSDWTTSNFRPSSESFFTVATTFPMTRASCMSASVVDEVDRVYDADDCRVDGPVLHAFGEARAGARDDEHALVEARADRVDGHDVAGAV